MKNPRVQKMRASPGEPVPRRIVEGVLNTPVPTIMLKLRNKIDTEPTEYPSEECTLTGAPDASSARKSVIFSPFGPLQLTVGQACIIAGLLQCKFEVTFGYEIGLEIGSSAGHRCFSAFTATEPPPVNHRKPKQVLNQSLSGLCWIGKPQNDEYSELDCYQERRV